MSLRVMPVLVLAGLLVPACATTRDAFDLSCDPVAGETSKVELESAEVTSRVAAVPAEAPAAPAACPPEMVLVEGSYCPEVEQPCKKWMDPPGPYQHFRCAEYDASVCRSARQAMRFCIDRTEHTPPGDLVPRNFLSFTDGQEICKASGKRLCKESEWQFACEGEEMRPYPYGFKRDESACNTDITEHLGRIGQLVDHRTGPGEKTACRSPFGVMDLAGNLEEWVEADEPMKKGQREVMKGSWWIPSRHACRSFQIGHGPRYGGGETGIRCCKGL